MNVSANERERPFLEELVTLIKDGAGNGTLGYGDIRELIGYARAKKESAAQKDKAS